MPELPPMMTTDDPAKTPMKVQLYRVALSVAGIEDTLSLLR